MSEPREPPGLVYVGEGTSTAGMRLPKGRGLAESRGDASMFLLPESTDADARAHIAAGRETPPRVSTTDGDGTERRATRHAPSLPTNDLPPYHPEFQPPDGRTLATRDGVDPRVVQFTGTGECSGAYVGPRHILTAAHCISDPTYGWFVPSTVIPGRQGVCAHARWACTDGLAEQPWGEKKVEAGIVPTEWLSGGRAEDDYALIVLEDEDSWGTWFGLSSEEPPKWLEHRGFPAADTNPCAASPGPSGTFYAAPPYDRECGGFQYGEQSRTDRARGSLLYTWHDVQGGHSGGPLYDSDVVYGALSSLEEKSGRAVFRHVDVRAVCSWIRSYPSTGFGHDCY